MGKIKTSELNGPPLDWVIATLLGEKFPTEKSLGFLVHMHGKGKTYATDYAVGGLLLDEKGVATQRRHRDGVWFATLDGAGFHDRNRGETQGETRLIAGLRCIAFQEYGAEVEVPDAVMAWWDDPQAAKGAMPAEALDGEGVASTQEPDVDDAKTMRQLESVAGVLREKLEGGLSKEWASLERPYPLALLLQQPRASFNCDLSFLSHEFTELCDAYAGLRAEKWVHPCVNLHAMLTTGNHTSADRKYELNGGGRIWAAADREIPGEALSPDLVDLFGPDYEPASKRAKAIVLETQDRNFLLILNESFGRWTLHLREFWPDIREWMVADDSYGGLARIKDRKDLSVWMLSSFRRVLASTAMICRELIFQNALTSPRFWRVH